MDFSKLSEVAGMLTAAGRTILEIIPPHNTTPTDPQTSVQTMDTGVTTAQSNQIFSVRGLGSSGPSIRHTTNTVPMPAPLTAPDRTLQRERQAEVSRLFQPYGTPRRSAPASRSSNVRRHSEPRAQRERSLDYKIMCLGGPDDLKAPLSTRKAQLLEAGLGHGVVELQFLDTSEHVESSIRRQFPKLQEVNIEIVQPVGAGRNQCLIRASGNDAIPNARYIFTSFHRTSTIYVRPLVTLLRDGAEPDQHPSSSGTGLDSRAQRSPSEQASITTNQHTNLEPVHGASNQVRDVAPEGHVSPNYRDSAMDTEDTDTEEELTIHDLRNRLYKENPGIQYINVDRKKLLRSIFRTYKVPRLNLLTEPDVAFDEEEGIDAGALKREFFWISMVALSREKHDSYPLFDGAEDHKLPSAHPFLLRTGMFSIIGKFMVHSALHTGVAFMGLSMAAVQYMFSESTGPDTFINMTVEDLPDTEARDCINIIDDWSKDGPSPSDDDLERIGQLMSETSIHLTVDFSNKYIVREHIMYYIIIEKRKAALDAFRIEFKKTPLFDFIVQRKELLLDSVFPKQGALFVPASVLVNKIQGQGPNFDAVQIVVNLLKEYLYGKLGKGMVGSSTEFRM